MQKLYDAANGIEAHMILNLLEQEGLQGRIDGEYLQGAIGQLPVSGLVRVMVEESDLDAAQALIKGWESSQEKTPAPQPPARPKSRAIHVLLGAIAGFAIAYAYFHVPRTSDALDHNGDGVVDEHWISAPSGDWIRTEQDRNFDGKPDYISYPDSKGEISHADADENFDGAFETSILFKHGNIDVLETDTTGDGLADYKVTYVSGVADHIDYFESGSRKIKKTEYLRLGTATHTDIDTNGDGKLDTRKRFNASGEEMASEPIP